jgi:hypothetical protein
MKAAVDGGLQLREGAGGGGGGGGEEEAILLSITQVIEKAVSSGSDGKAYSSLKELFVQFEEKGRETILNALREALLMVEGGKGGGGENVNETQ